MISLLKSKSDLFNKRALYISADKLSLYHWVKGELGGSYLFNNDDAGQENFKRYLQETPNTPIYIIVDVVEEEFRQDTIPHVFGADKKALIQRKQTRLFRHAGYYYTHDLGREAEGRRDDRLLFMAINNREILKPWVSLLYDYKVPLKGIISIPLLLHSFIKTLPGISDHALVVSLQGISGLRQTYFNKRELQISRLSKLPRFGTTAYGPIIFSDVEKIHRYLNSLRLIPNNVPLDVYFLTDKAQIEDLENQVVSSPLVRRNYLDLSKLSDSGNVEAGHSTPFCDRLLMRHLFKTNIKNCYAVPEEMHYSTMRSIRYAMNTASLLLLVFSVLYGGISLVNGLTYKQQSEASENKAAYYRSRYDRAHERLPATPVEPAQIKVAVEAAAKIDEYKSTPYEMLVYLGKGLSQYPTITLDNFDWRYSIEPGSGATDGVADSAEPEHKIKYYHVANIQAHLEPFNGDYRAAIATVNEFAETLRGFDATHTVTVKSFPLDISSSARLEGNADSVGKEALFSLTAVIGVN